MRILLLSQFYRPEPDLKVHPLAEDLARRGHTVTVVTGYPNYPLGRVFEGYRQRPWRWETQGPVRVLRLPLYADHSRSPVRRSLNYLSFAASASFLGPLLCGAVDAIWVYCPPLTAGVPAWWMGLLRRAPFVFNVHDMWPETLLATGMVGSGRLLGWLGALARFVYRQAAAITVVSPGFKRNLMEKGVRPDKIHVIPNWADEGLYRPVAPDPALAARCGMARRFNVVFAGNMGLAQGLDTVLEAAALLGDLPQVQFVLIGDGVASAELAARAGRQGLANVRFLPRQPAERMPQFYALADALLVHLKRDPLFEITIPSKTLAYLACGRPILCAVAGDGAEVVRSVGAGVVCPPQEPAALAQAVRELYAMPAAGRERMGQAGRRAFLAGYTRRALVDRYEALLSQVAERHRCGVGGGPCAS